MYVRKKGGYDAFPLMTEVTSIHAPKIMKKIMRLILAVVLVFAMAVPCYAANFSFAWNGTEFSVGDDAERVPGDLAKANNI